MAHTFLKAQESHLKDYKNKAKPKASQVRLKTKTSLGLNDGITPIYRMNMSHDLAQQLLLYLNSIERF